MTAWSRPLAALLVALLLAGCAGGPPPSSTTGPPGSGPAASSQPPASDAPLAALTVDDAIDTLAAAGIAVYEEPGATAPIREPAAPVSPFALLGFQVENLVRDAGAGGGVPADRIDDLIPMPEDTVPFSAVLAGYVATAVTPGGRAAAELMADQDLEVTSELWFPSLVLVLFVGEVAGAAETLEARDARLDGPTARLAVGAGGPSVPDVRLAAADPCGDFSRFLAGTIQRVSDAILSVIPHIPFIGAAIDWALQRIGDAAKELLGHVPFLTALREGVKLLALAATVVASLRDWPVSVTAAPTAAHHSVGATVEHVTLTAVVDDGPGDLFSDPVRTCAKLLDIELPRGGAPGSAVEWRILAGGEHMAPGLEQDRAIDASLRVRFGFDTADEPQRNHEGGRLASGRVAVEVTVKRQDVAQVRRLIEQVIVGAIPPVVWNAVVGLFGDPIAKLTAWTDPTGRGAATVSYHGEPQPSASPSDEPSPSGSPSPSPSPSSDPRDAFCSRYRALVAWGRAPTEEELSRPWAAYVASAFIDMRPFAPAHLVGSVDVAIETYSTYAIAEEPFNVPLAGPSAARLGDAVIAMHRYCGLPLDDGG